MEKKEPKRIRKKKTGAFGPGWWCCQPGPMVLICPGCLTRDKMVPLLSRLGCPGWETRTKGVSKSG